MSHNVPRKQPAKSVRLTKIIAGLKKGKLYSELAAECGCSEKTIDRAIADWKDNGCFDKWLLSEFLRLHSKELSKKEGGEAYHTIADLLKKRLKETSEVEMKGETFKVEIIDNSKVSASS
jgi:hypothetical protein